MSVKEIAPELHALLEYLRTSRAFDFSGYKLASLQRRIDKRMLMVGINGYENYRDYLEVHPEEFGELFNTILINVTSFFRDPQTWDYIAAEIIPDILKNKGENDSIRVWSAGCATGEEAYTIAMLLAEAIGLERFRHEVKIYATDLDDPALNHARQALYREADVEAVPEALRQKYFTVTPNGEYQFDKELRRCVIFGRHDLLVDAPISRIDFLICRNALMYFNSESQHRILARFHFALSDKGYLFLGKAEMLLTHSALFTPVDLRRRVFRKVQDLEMRDRFIALSQNNDGQAAEPGPNADRFGYAAFASTPVAQMVVDPQGTLALANERARSLFNLHGRDIGRPLGDLAVSQSPLNVRSLVDQSIREHRTLFQKEVEWKHSGGERYYLDVMVSPLSDPAGGFGSLISFSDVTRPQRLQEELHRSNQSLEEAHEELQSATEELETTNEELQSSVEELETTNEELQSTNEELETMNEELQSTNEELQTINDELRQRSDELNEVNNFLESILTSLRKSVVVVDQDMKITAWNDRASDLWGLREEEAHGKNFLNLDIGLPVEKLRQHVRQCIRGESDGHELVLQANNRRGKEIHCRVVCTPLADAKGQVRGAILLMDDATESGEPHAG
jgi:two-component system, chemotaxis family, CheB/CheR fusion protein